MHRIESKAGQVTIADKGQLEIRDLQHGTSWDAEHPFWFGYGEDNGNPIYQYDLWEHCEHQVTQTPDSLRIHFDHFGWWAGFPEHTYHKPEGGPELEFDFEIRLCQAGILFTIGAVQGLDEEHCQLSFPHGMNRLDCQEAGGVAIPCGYGAWFPFPRTDMFKLTYQYIYDYNCLPIYGVFGKRGGLGVRLLTPCDQRTCFDVAYGRRGQASMETVFLCNRRFANYPRQVEWRFMAPGSTYVDLAKWYRNSLQEEGTFVSLKEKCRRYPETEKLIGAVIWKHNVYSQKVLPEGVKRDYSLYAQALADADIEHFPANRSAYELFETAKKDGFDRVCVFNTGWNHLGYDSGYPTRLPPAEERGTPEEFAQAAQYARSLSEDFIYSVHDNYIDCYENAAEDYEQNLSVDEDGNVRRGGIWRGGRASILCVQKALNYAQRDVPKIVRMLGRGAVYTDVYGCCDLKECHSPAHPQSRREDLVNRRKLLGYIRDQFGALATEGAPCADLADIVALGAYCSFFCPMSRPAASEDPWTVPLWQLVFHDSVLGYSSRGGSMLVEDYNAMCALYGLLPGTLDAVGLKLSRELRQVYESEMVSHEYLTPVTEGYHGVARTVFSCGIQIIANMTDKPFAWGAETIPPHEYAIQKLAP